MSILKENNADFRLTVVFVKVIINFANRAD